MQKFKGEPLNVLHTIGLDQLYPVVRCQINAEGHIDQKRLANALSELAKIIPEILCRYEMSDNSWVPVESNPGKLIKVDVSEPDQDAQTMDLMSEPQLRIYLNSTGDTDTMIIYISHILTDGAGSKQLLYLLSKAYNDPKSGLDGFRNRQDIDWLEKIIKNTPVSQSGEADHPSKPLALPQLANANIDKHQYFGTVVLSNTLTNQLVLTSHKCEVTLNDVFMATFGKTIQRFSQNDWLSMACPTDMRQFIAESEGEKITRVANHTSRYNINLHAPVSESVQQTVQKVHQAMNEAKAKKQCFESIAGLLANYDKYSLRELQKIVEKSYHIRPIAYTNFGIIDNEALSFNDVRFSNVIMTGGFRTAPMFQVAVSTFNNRISLAFNMTGSKDDFLFGMGVTQTMADLINNYASDSLDSATESIDNAKLYK